MLKRHLGHINIVLRLLLYLKDKSGANKIIVKKQSFQLLNTNREFFPTFDACNVHKFVNESS